MNFTSILIENAVNEFAKLPGIGKKTALRLVLHLLNSSTEEVKEFTHSIQFMQENITFCSICSNVSDENICSVCSNPLRNQQTVCVVESIREVMAIENTGQYKGRYHVLGGIISPINGVGPEQLNVEQLLTQSKEQEVHEVIMALNPTIDGDTTVFYLSKELRKINPEITITTIARGISFGGELEYVDEVTLARSLATRLPFENYLSS